MKELIKERHNTHGSWRDQSCLSQWFKDGAQAELGYENLNYSQREALDNIFLKISRIVCGDASHEDHWNDIAGYAALGAGHGEKYVKEAKKLRRTKGLRNGKALA